VAGKSFLFSFKEDGGVLGGGGLEGGSQAGIHLGKVGAGVDHPLLAKGVELPEVVSVVPGLQGRMEVEVFLRRVEVEVFLRLLSEL
jgi:hypothetical protein